MAHITWLGLLLAWAATVTGIVVSGGRVVACGGLIVCIPGALMPHGVVGGACVAAVGSRDERAGDGRGGLGSVYERDALDGGSGGGGVVMSRLSIMWCCLLWGWRWWAIR